MATVPDKANPGSKTDPHLPGKLKVVKLTQAEYDALTSPDENILYVIVAG